MDLENQMSCTLTSLFGIYGRSDEVLLMTGERVNVTLHCGEVMF